MSAARTRAWRSVVEQVAGELGAPWLVTGSGLRTSLTWAPVGWWLSQVGFDRRSGRLGILHATHRSLTVPVKATYTMEMDSYYGDDSPRRGYDPEEEDAAYVLTWWANKAVSLVFRARTQDELIGMDETDYVERHDSPPITWPTIAGWRVINDSGSPVPVIEDVLARLDSGAWMEDERPFWTGFKTVAEAGDRRAMLEFLDEQRRAGLASIKVPESAIMSVLAEESR